MHLTVSVLEIVLQLYFGLRSFIEARTAYESLRATGTTGTYIEEEAYKIVRALPFSKCSKWLTL